jgi:low affinity Fe/Cu permease
MNLEPVINFVSLESSRRAEFHGIELQASNEVRSFAENYTQSAHNHPGVHP